MKLVILYYIIMTICASNAFAICSDEYAMLVFDANSQKILEQKRAYNLKYPASLVKMMTLYLTFEAIEKGDLDYNTKLIVSERASEQWKFNADLEAGGTITVKEGILGIIVKSFNDFAVVLSEAVAGNEWDFVKVMNEKAKELGLENTSFRNAAGFTDLQQETTAYDIMKLVQAIKQNFPKQYAFFSAKKFEFNGETFESHNHVLVDYPWAEGMKTGFTKASGYNLATTASKNGKDLIAIVISCSEIEGRDDFMISTLDKYFDNKEGKN